jgi:hypothetical protein
MVERGLPDYGKSTVYNVRWSHSKDPKSSPNSTFSALLTLVVVITSDSQSIN